MEHAENRHLLAIIVQLMNDDVWQAGHGPLIRAGDDADAAKLGEFAEAVGLDEDALHDMGGGSRAAPFDIEADGSDMGKRFKREAHFHKVISEFCAALQLRPRSRDGSYHF